LGDANRRSDLDEGALFGSRLIFGWHFPFRFTQTKDARALCGKLSLLSPSHSPASFADRDLIEMPCRMRNRQASSLEVCLIARCEASAQTEDHSLDGSLPFADTDNHASWTPPTFAAVVHAPCAKPGD
jgi:hypothetical protein